jgi:glycosyltransferase involved in cell wall biosynthesis
MKVLVIIPAYNEAGNIEKTVMQFKKVCPSYDYVIVNDCSTDNTEEICITNKLNFISLPCNLGIGGCVQTGYKYAARMNYDIAVQMDGDGQHNPVYIKDLIKPIVANEADICIGSRFVDKNKDGFQSTQTRRIGITLLSKLIKACCGVKIYDVTSGFRAVNNKFINIYSQEYADDYPEPEAIIAAVFYKGKIKEIPVSMNARTQGKSSINAAKSMYYMIKVSLSILIYHFIFNGGE